jgi:hypothetical protein
VRLTPSNRTLAASAISAELWRAQWSPIGVTPATAKTFHRPRSVSGRTTLPSASVTILPSRERARPWRDGGYGRPSESGRACKARRSELQRNALGRGVAILPGQFRGPSGRGRSR